MNKISMSQTGLHDEKLLGFYNHQSLQLQFG